MLLLSSQIWKEILQSHPNPDFMLSQVYSEWARVNETVWRLDKDQVTSAQLLLKADNSQNVEIIGIREEPGIHVIAFALKPATRSWAAHAVELALDGTCKWT